MKRKKVLIALPFGQTVRDVLRSETYEVLRNRSDIDIHVCCTGANDEGFVEEFSGPNITMSQLKEYSPNRLELLLQSVYLSTLAFRSNTIRIYAEFDKKSSLRKLIPISNVCSAVFGRFRFQKLLGWFMKKANPERAYKSLFDSVKPDLVVVTRVLRASPDYPILKEADIRGLPVIALVSSWDNFTTKGFFPFGVKKLVVWNQVMEDEAVNLFGFDRSDIFQSGIPRFDMYFNKTQFCSRNTFFQRYGLDNSKRLITYTTGNKTAVLPPGDRISAEVDIVKLIAKEISNGDLANVHLLVRLHPLAEPEDFEILKAYNNVTIQIPGAKNKFRDRLFSKIDDIEIAETMLHSDVVINVASTMTIDSAAFDTPSISIRFDIRGELPFEHSVKKYYEYEHYRVLRETGGVDIVDSPEELISKINHVLEYPSYLKEERNNIVLQQVKYPDGKAGYRVGCEILDYLDSL